jgi:hypothetical protein
VTVIVCDGCEQVTTPSYCTLELLGMTVPGHLREWHLCAKCSKELTKVIDSFKTTSPQTTPIASEPPS